MLIVCHQTIKSEIDPADYVAIQVDKTTRFVNMVQSMKHFLDFPGTTAVQLYQDIFQVRDFQKYRKTFRSKLGW